MFVKAFSFLSFHRSDGVMRTMNTEKLLKTIPIIQNQMDVLLDFNVSVHCWLHWLASKSNADTCSMYYLQFFSDPVGFQNG